MLDFIFVLSIKELKLYNIFFIILYKFFKTKIFILERDDYSTTDWAVFY